MKRNFCLIVFACLLCLTTCNRPSAIVKKPNVLFIMMDDLGYGQFGIYNDTLKTSDFDPFYVHLVDSLEGYSLDKALEFTKRAIPTMTELAKNGITFTRAHTTCNVCAPSRLGIATGTMQTRFGVYTNGDIGTQGIIPGTHLAENFKARGYKTAHIGKWHIGSNNEQLVADILNRHGIEKTLNQERLRTQYPEAYMEVEKSGYLGSVIDEHNPLNNGFDYYFGYNYWASQFYNSYLVWENFKHDGKQEGYNTDVFTDRTIRFMEEQIDNDNPFYIQLHYHAVHDSLEPRAPEKYLSRFDADYFQLNNFYAHIYGVDQNIKRLVGSLKSKGQYENTMIVFTSDNGAMSMGAYDGIKRGSPLPANAPFKGHKGTYYQGGIRVPLFIHFPDGIKQNGISRQIVSTMDIIPTAIEVTGGKVPEGIDGRSMTPLFNDPNGTAIHDHLIWAGSHAYNQGYLVKKTNKTHLTAGRFGASAWAVIQDDYLLRFTGELPPNVYLDHMQGREPVIELFNISADPAERNNIAEQFPEKVKEMSKLYFEGSTDYIPPARWSTDKWRELESSQRLF
ncbi:sulfatase [Bacteroidota bacterium]